MGMVNDEARMTNDERRSIRHSGIRHSRPARRGPLGRPVLRLELAKPLAVGLAELRARRIFLFLIILERRIRLALRATAIDPAVIVFGIGLSSFFASVAHD